MNCFPHLRSCVSWSCAITVAVSLAAAQQQADLPTPRTQPVVQRLQQITVLPLPEWRVHDDNVLHPEDPRTSDSDWATSKVKDEWNTGPRWFRCRVEIPATLSNYDIRNATVRLNTRINGENPIFVRIFVDGKLVAEGQDMDPQVVIEHAEAGRKLLLAIKADVPGGRSGMYVAQLEFAGSSGRPDASLLSQELQAVDSLIESAGEGREQRRAQLDGAIVAIDWSALERHDQGTFDASMRAAQAKLMPLRAWLSTLSIHATGNSHIDMAWLWPSSETVEVVRNTWATALQLMREYPQFTYTHSSAAAYDWMEEKYPRMFDQIRARVREGRWEPIGGMWVEPDLNMPDGESLVRQLLIGSRYFKDRFRVQVRTGWNPDSFGYSWQLPQIYKKSGMDFFVTQKIYWNDTTKFPHKLFWWEAPDGSRILTYFPHDYGNPIDPVAMAKDLANYSALTGYPETLHLYGVGDHGGGPTRSMLDNARRWQQADVAYPKLEMGPAKNFFDQLAPKVKTLKIPVWRNELYLQYHRGVYTSQAATKRNNRRSEELLLNAEKFSSLATLFGQAYPHEAIDQGWKKVLFNQFHDILAGSSIAAVYRDAARDYAVVHDVAQRHLESALDTIHERVNTTGPGVPVLVFNPLAWARTDIVEFEVHLPQFAAEVQVRDAGGKPVPAQVISRAPETRGLKVLFLAEDIPALGYKLFHFAAAPKATHATSSPHAGENQIENEYLRVRVDASSGCITSLYDKQHQREVFEQGKCGNLLQAFHDLPREYDAWNIDSNFEDQKWDIDKAQDVRLIEDGALRKTIRVVRKFQNSSFAQDIRLYSKVARVDVATTAEWHEKHILIKAAFPLSLQSKSATYEIPFGSIPRPTTRLTPEEKAMFEVPALRWADLSDGSYGVSILNESKYGYDGRDNVLRLSLLRSPAYPDPHADEGLHHFEYAIYPHAGGWQKAGTVRRGYEFNYRLIPLQVTSHTGELPAAHSFVSITPENLVLTAFKQSESGDGLVLRFYESQGEAANAHIQLPSGAVSAWETNLMEKRENDLPISNDAVMVAVRPFEIRTIEVQFGAKPMPRTTAARQQ